jgi:hypothetical protein
MKSTPRSQRPLFAVIAVVAASLTATFVVHGSEPAESGWSVARPKSVLDAKHADNAQIRIAINHVLEQGQSPLLLTPAPQRPVDESFAEIELPPAENTTEPPTEDSPAQVPKIVFSQVGVSADGWRPAHLPTTAPRTAPIAEETAEDSITPVEEKLRTSASDTQPVQSPKAIEAFTPVAITPTDEADDEANDQEEITIDEEKANETEVAKPAVESKTEPKVESSRPAQTATPPVVEKPAAPPLPPLTQNQKNLRAKVRRVIKSYYTRPLNSRDNDPWELMHGMLAYGVKSQIRQGSPQGKTITLVGWMCYNRPSKGFTLLYMTPENELRAKQGVGLQGHMGQFLAMLAQCQVSPDYPIRVRNSEFTIKDLIEAEKETCYPKTELTFKLIALMHYLDSDDTWVNDQGQSWNIPRLIREELAQPIRGAACGGTHRLSGLSLAARTRVRRGEPLDGEYLRAAQFVEKYQNYAFQLQNRDGSLSTEWFRGRGDEDDTDRRVKTTGHILEWLCYSVEDKEVRSARMFRAANYLSSLLSSNFNHEWEVGPLGHAIHALRLYDERVFQPYDGQEEVAKKPARKSARRPSNSSSRSKSSMY